MSDKADSESVLHEADRLMPKTWDEAVEVVLEMQRQIMFQRQDKYGPQNILDQGLFGVVTRADADKMARIKRALNGRIINGQVILDPIDDGSDAADTFEDGCIDLANYMGPIAIMLRRGWWELPRRVTEKGR
jgi:hypothetical protein